MGNTQSAIKSGDHSDKLSNQAFTEECDHQKDKEKKLIFVITPKNVSYNFRRDHVENFDPSNESETSTISSNLKNHKCIEILFQHTSSFHDIAETCREKNPAMLIFYTHGLPHDSTIELSADKGEKVQYMSSNRVKDIFEYAKRNNKSFNPFVLIGACFSDRMAEAIHEETGFPVVGFTGEIRPSVLTRFIIYTIVSFAHDVHFEDAFNCGLEEIKKDKEFKLARLHARFVPRSWLHYFSSFLKNEAEATSTFEKIGFFQRLASTDGRHINVINTHTELVVFTVFTKKKKTNDQIQLHILAPDECVKVYFPNNEIDSVTVSMFTLHESGREFLHHQTRKVESSYNFRLKKKVLQTHHAYIPGFKGVKPSQIKRYHERYSSSSFPLSSTELSSTSSE